MLVEENKAFIRRYLEAVANEEKSEANINRFVADQELKDHIKMFEASFPRYQLVPEDIIAEGDRVVVRSTFVGTHLGDFMGIPATGKQVKMPLIIIYRLADGKIVEHWMVADVMSLMQQISPVPVSAS
ncbi:MAG TPA: ester cyclase [Chloroflexia bacterium]|nr:ester cyclase [Chloroflexia bacterium]